MKTKSLLISKMFLAGILFLTSSMTSMVFGQTWTPTNYWTFDGTIPLKDSMGTSSLDPLYYASTYTVSPAQSGVGVGKYMTFTGKEKIILGATNLALDTGFTVEMLFRWGPNAHETMEIFGRRDAAIDIRMGFPFIRFSTAYYPTGSSSRVNDIWEISLNGLGRGTFGYYADGNWHHLVFKFNAKAGVKEIWVDGQNPAGFSKTVTPGLLPSNTGNLSDNITSFNTLTTYYSTIGDVDEVATYKFPLPGNMIYKHYTEFLQNKHYSFTNTTTPAPAADPITGPVDLTEYAPGHPNANVDAITQLQTFPNARFKAGHTLFPNVQVFDPAYVAGWFTSNYSNQQLIQRSKQVQRELVVNFNYALQLSNNSGSYYAYGDTNTYAGAYVKYANQNPSWKTAVNSYWPQLKPTDAGKNAREAYIYCGCLTSNSYLRNSSSQNIDEYGNVISSYKVVSPESPVDSLKLDGQTQRFYLDQLTKKLTRSLDIIFENGEVVPRWTQNGLSKDPTVLAAFNASGLNNWHKYVGRAMNRFSSTYVNEFMTLPALANTRLIYYQINGNPDYSWDYSETRTLNTKVNNQYYSSGDIYMMWPSNWRYWSADAHGWQFLIDSRYPELSLGDKLYGPTVSPGFSSNEEANVRPAQWLGFLKAVGMTGAEYFNTGYFVLYQPYQNPMNYVWQMVMPGYAQGISSRYEDFLRNGTLMSGDVPNNIITAPNQPGYTFYAGDTRKLVVARKHNTQAKYVITGTIQPNNNMKGNAELETVATIKMDGQPLTFKIRRQGSTYIYDLSTPSAPVFYQLDGWHENTHPYAWDKTFKLEAELFDNTNSNAVIKTEVPAGSKPGDFTTFTSYVSFATPSSVEFNFTPRGTTPVNHYVWVRARSKNGVTTGFNLQLDGTINNSVTCVRSADWTWYCLDATNSLPITYTNLSLQNHKLTVYASTTSLEIDQITITPQSGNYYSAYAPACSQSTSAIANITANGPVTFCQGGNVSLSANAGTNYVWSNGATTQTIAVTTAGSYVVTVTTSAGTATSTPANVSVNSLPTNGITASGPTTFCQGNNVNLSSTATNCSYQWSNGATTAVISVSVSGNYIVTATSTSGCSTVSSPVSVIANSAIPATITSSGSTNFCQGSNVNLTANSGTAYLWSNGATTSTINVSNSGNYIVTVTQSGGCTSVSSPISVTSITNTPSSITASGSTTFCKGSSVTLTANNGTSFNWSNGATTPSITINAAGTYTVTVKQASGCGSVSTPTTVTVNNVPLNTITTSGPTTFCTGGSVTLTSNATGSTYLWSNGATTSSITTSVNGNYIVTATSSNGCSSTSSVVSVASGNALPSSITVAGATTFCKGGSVALTANQGSSYLWSTGETTASIIVTAAGKYNVSVTQNGGCSTTSPSTTVTVKGLPTSSITASGSTTFCQGGSVVLTSSVINQRKFLWSNGATTSSITANTSGSYILTVTSTNGCTASSTPTTVIANSSTSATITANGSTTFCQGGSVQLTASSGSSYLWSTGATTASINATTSGNYIVTVTQAGGCNSVSSPISVTAGSGSTVAATISPSGTINMCQGAFTTLRASSGSSYLWSNGATTSTITVGNSGNYVVTVTQTGGCASTSSATIINVLPVASFTIGVSGPLTFCNGGSVTMSVISSTPNIGYVWYKNNSTIPGANNPTYVINSAGTYVVRVQLGGCGVFSNRYTVTIPCREGQMNEINSSLNFTAYPNPFNEQTTLAFELSKESNVTIKILDMTGKLVDVVLDDAHVSAGETKVEYQTGHLANGIYLAEIITPSVTKRIRIDSIK